MSRYLTIAAAMLGIGLVAAAAAFATGSVAFLWNAEAIGIVLGGSLIATVASAGPTQTATAIKLVRVIAARPADPLRIARWWIDLNIAWRREGVQALARYVQTAPSPQLGAIVQFCADGIESDDIVRLAEQLLATDQERYGRAAAFFRRLAGYAPTMGIIGTVIGLASALGAGDQNPQLLLQRIGFAFSATLWGLVTANFLWLPIAQRVESLLDEQRTIDRINVEAARLVSSGSTPLLTRYHLATLLPDTLGTALLAEESTIGVRSPTIAS